MTEKSCVINGIEWHPFACEYKTQEGSFTTTIYACDEEHAIYVLDELKSTIKVNGRLSNQENTNDTTKAT